MTNKKKYRDVSVMESTARLLAAGVGGVGGEQSTEGSGTCTFQWSTQWTEVRFSGRRAAVHRRVAGELVLSYVSEDEQQRPVRRVWNSTIGGSYCN